MPNFSTLVHLSLGKSTTAQKTHKKRDRRNFLPLAMLLALYLCVFLGFKESYPTDILCTHGQNNTIYHIKKLTQYVFWN
jgi:hypothetical protein